MLEDLLLDTCAAIRLVEGAPFPAAAVAAFNRSAAAGKTTFASLVGPPAWYNRRLDLPLISEAVLSADSLIASSHLPGNPHGDPFDRAILATARERGLTTLTRDARIPAYAEAGRGSAIAC